MTGKVQRTAAASYIQRAMWINAQRQRGAALNVIILAWRMQGPLKISALRDAVNDVIARHEALRTRLEFQAGQLLQVIEENSKVEFSESAVEGSTPDARWDAAHACLREEGRQPIDITVAPPIRARLIRLSEADHVLCLFVHHAMCDGWSSQVIMRDLAALYGARTQGIAANLLPLKEQYAEFAEAQIRSYETGGFSSETAYWRAELSDMPPPMELPGAGPRKGNRDWLANSPTVIESPELLATLKEFARRRRASAFSALLAAFAVLLHQRTGATDMIIGVSIVNRWNSDTMQMVGCLTNLLPARIHLNPDLEFDKLVRQVHATIRRLLAYGRMPLEMILREIRGPLALGLGLPIWCQLRESAPSAIVDGNGLSLTPVLVDRGTILADLDADLIETSRGLESVFAYRNSLFESNMITELMNDYSAILHLLADGADDLRADAMCRRVSAGE